MIYTRAVTYSYQKRRAHVNVTKISKFNYNCIRWIMYVRESQAFGVWQKSVVRKCQYKTVDQTYGVAPPSGGHVKLQVSFV